MNGIFLHGDVIYSINQNNIVIKLFPIIIAFAFQIGNMEG